MKRIIIIGSPGAGKSTFSRNLRDRSGLPLYHLDNIWHQPDRTTISREEFDEKLLAILAKESWIIDGNYSRTLELRLKYCDTVFLLDYPLEVCLAGVNDRIGKEREDIPWIEYEFDEEFRQFIVEFPENRLPNIYRLPHRYEQGREIHIFRSRKEADEYLRLWNC